MTPTASPRRPPPALAAATTVASTEVRGSGDTTVAAVDPSTRGVA